MKRFAVPLVIVGSLAVLAALFVLLRSITAESPAAPVPTVTRTETPQPPAPTPSSASPSSPAPGPAPQLPRPRAEAPAPSDDRPAPTTAGSSDGAPGTRLNTKNLQFGLPQLREKIAANAPAVSACVGSAKPTGEATLTFIVAQRAGKVFVEQTDVDRDKSTLQDETLLDCLQKTAMQIQFDGLPREAEAIIVTRTLALQDGAIAEDKPLKFSYIR